MKNTLETRLGLFAAIIVLAAILVLHTLGSLENLKQGKRVHALFNSAMELKEGDRVRMAGVEIGRVEKIQIVDSKVKVTLKLKADAVVKADSTATIRFAGLLGQNFVAVDFGSPSERLADNNTYLPTAEQPDLSAIFQRLDNVAAGVENLTKSFSGDKIDNIIGPLTDFFKQNNSQFSATVTNIKVITGQIADGKGTVGKLVMDSALYDSTLTAITNLQNAGNDLSAITTDARSIMADAKAGKGTVGKLITDEALYHETTDSMRNLKEILEKMNKGQGTVGKLVNDDQFYKNAKMTLQKLDKATEGLEDQGPISVMGTLFNAIY